MPETRSDVAQRNMEVVRAAVEAFGEGGGRELIRRYDEFFAPELEWRPALTGGLDGRTYRGKDGFVAYWDDFYEGFEHASFPEMAFEMARQGVVLGLGRMQVRGRESGVTLEIEAGFLYEMRDGLVARMTSYFSHAEAREAAVAA